MPSKLIRRLPLTAAVMALTIGGASLALATEPEAFDDTQASVTIEGGALSVGLEGDLNFGSEVAYSREDQTLGADGSVRTSLTVDDMRGEATPSGWHVTVTSDGLTSAEAESIENDQLVVAPKNLESVEGSLENVSLQAGGSLSEERTVLNADAEFGDGKYTADLELALTIPGATPAGDYEGNVTVSAYDGPQAES